MFWVEKKFLGRKFFGLKKFLGRKKNFVSKKILGRKISITRPSIYIDVYRVDQRGKSHMSDDLVFSLLSNLLLTSLNTFPLEITVKKNDYPSYHASF